ncbi:Uncharacterized protein FWK35_00036588, partial [Aphis craccivora]
VLGGDISPRSPPVNTPLLFIHFNMPTLQNWDPRPAIQIWLNQNERRIKDTPKAKEQEWFNGIFMEATKRKSEEQTELKTKKRMF